MKRIIYIGICLCMILGLGACQSQNGDVSSMKTHEVESKMYSQEDIASAIEVIKKDFQKDFKGCTLKEIYYAGDEFTAGYQEWAERNNADEVLVLLSSFDVSASATEGSLNPGSTYEGWNWILVRNNGGAWKHVDHGY